MPRARAVASRLLGQRGLRAAVLRAGRTDRYCVVHGNCQAEPPRQLLAATASFPFATVALRPVHEMTAEEADLVRRLLRRTAVFVAQPVYNNYQGLAIGTDELQELLPSDARTVRFPVHYHEGLHPFQVHVRVQRYPVPAPLTAHHDLRFLHCASQGWDLPTSVRWLQEGPPPPAAVQSHAERSLALLAQREVDLDTAISDQVPAAGAGAFLTMPV